MIRPKCSLRDQPTRWEAARLDQAGWYLGSELWAPSRGALSQRISKLLTAASERQPAANGGIALATPRRAEGGIASV